MGLPAFFSALLHLCVLALVIWGLPFKKAPVEDIYRPLPVEFVPLGPETTAPKPVLNPQKEKDFSALDTPKKAQSVPTSQPESPPEIKPQPEPMPKPDLSPRPATVSPSKAEPSPPPKTQVAPAPQPAADISPAPDATPKETEALNSLIKELAVQPEPEEKAIKPSTKPALATKPQKKPESKKKPKGGMESLLKNLLKNQEEANLIDPKEQTEGKVSSQTGKVANQLSVSEMDSIRQQLSKCWNIPAGARDISDLSIPIRIWMNPDGTMREARLINSASPSSNPFYRTLEESALRAVHDPNCFPLKLPPEKYETWKVFVFNFSPKDLK